MARTAACFLLLVLLLSLSLLQHQSLSSPHPTLANMQTQPTPKTAEAHSEANARIKRSIDDLLQGDLLLQGVKIETTVDDEEIILTGTVDNYSQHQRVLALADQYSRWRRIVDKLIIK